MSYTRVFSRRPFLFFIFCNMGMVLSIVQFSAAKLQEYLDEPDKFEFELRSLEDNKIDKPVYLDKSWEAIHFILTGNKIGSGEPPLSLAVYSEQFFDKEQDLGMGPASYLTPEQVKEMNSWLEMFDDDYVKGRYDITKMNELRIYQHPWSANPVVFEYVLDNFQKLKAFYKEVASKDHAIASYLG